MRVQDSPTQLEPPDAKTLWQCARADNARCLVRMVLVTLWMLVPMTLTAALGTIGFSGVDGSAVASFWPASAFQAVFSIWFGVWGVAAGVVGPMLGNAIVGEAFWQYAAANLVQSAVPGLWFRWRKLDPRLRTGRDWLELVLVCVLLTNLLGAAAGTIEHQLRPGPAGADAAAAGVFLPWLLGNVLPALVLAPALLKAGSSMVVRGAAFCQSFWRPGNPSPSNRFIPRFDDAPIVVKLLLLTMVAGVGPLSLVAGWMLIGTLRQADVVAAEANRDVAREIRSSVERHALLLESIRNAADQPHLDADQRAALLARWNRQPEGFADLRVMDVADALAQARQRFDEATLEANPVLFFEPTWADPTRSGTESVIFGLAQLQSQPGRAIVGQCLWRDDQPMSSRFAAVGAVFVFDDLGRTLYVDARAPSLGLDDWRFDPGALDGGAGRFEHAGREFYLGQAPLRQLGWRFVTVTPARLGRATVLQQVPDALLAGLNLTIFVSVIAGLAIARRISNRVLGIADRVRQSGSDPASLELPVAGRDEFGYLAETLNRVNRERIEYIRQLRETTAEKERLATEMDLAREVQRTILPETPPSIENYEIAAFCRPAREVGGDFFDFFAEDDWLMVMIGDAAGKGLKAAMYITETHGLAHSVARLRTTPDQILAEVNASICSSRGETENFITMFCAALQPRQHRLLYSSAGHNPPVRVRDGQVQRLKLGGVPLAVMQDSEYELHELSLAVGDAVILYTDGVTEAKDVDEQLYELQRLEAEAARAPAESAAELLQRVVASVTAFAGAAPQSDDMTLVVLRRVR